MAIRITGMYSGLDTESIINELASAQSHKKTKLVKAQKKFSWKQDAWKALNTKVYSFYQKLDDLCLQSSYLKKKSVVSRPSAVQVVSGADTVDGVHTLSVNQLAKRAYLTSGSLVTANGTHFRSGAKLSQLEGMKDFTDGKISVNGALGQTVEIEVDGDMTINDFVSKLQKTGLNASFDEENQRFYISSRDTGKDANFSITANDAGGFKALAALGLMTDFTSDTTSAAAQENAKWASYYDSTGSGLSPEKQAEKDKLIEDLLAQRAAAYKKQDDTLKKNNEELDKANVYNKEELAKLDGYSKYGDISTFKDEDGNSVSTYADMRDALLDKIYGKEQPKKDKDGNDVKDDKGNTVMERNGGLTKDLADKKEALANLKKEGSGATAAQIEAAENAVKDAEKELAQAKDCYSFVNAIATNEEKKAQNQATIDSHAGTYTVNGDKVEGTAALKATITTEVDTKAAAAHAAINGAYLPKNPDGTVNKDKLAHKIEGQDSVITLNGVKYTSYNNSLSVNGMTITAMEETGEEEVTISTSTDTDGIFDMIKGLFTEYNALVNEMDSLYNAESSTGYDPLTAEEKSALSDDEIEEWEKKIKDSLLRRDSTLGNVSSAIRNVMLKGVDVNGRTMYLSDFGIETQSYFKAKENERNAYHILGDKDDPLSWNPEEGAPDLRSMIAKDPDTVVSFFTGLANNMHDELFKKMSATKLSSALTVYNDKQMKEEYDSYTEKIKKEEDKLNALMDKWYAKFSAMETAMAKLESKNNSLSSLFGG
ncbi:MAG: flagellar filament capping protein FliD [Lachnospiraceae bacterium]